jgi:hypothetical protein
MHTGAPLIVDETAQALFTKATEVGIVLVDNPNDATVYLKIFRTDTAPTVATDEPDIVIPCPAGVSQAVLFSHIGASYIAATAESDAGETTPGDDLLVTITSREI